MGEPGTQSTVQVKRILRELRCAISTGRRVNVALASIAEWEELELQCGQTRQRVFSL